MPRTAQALEPTEAVRTQSRAPTAALAHPGYQRGGAVGGRHRLTMIFLPRCPSFLTCLALKVSMLLVMVELWRGWRDLQVKVNCPWSGELHLTHGPWPPPLPRSFVGKRFAGSPNRQYSAGCLDSDRHMLATLHVTRA